MACFDVIVSGAGPAGLTLSCYLAKAGFKVAVFEQAPFPRHQIGESLLPFSWRVFSEIDFAETIANAGFIKKYGACFHSERSNGTKAFLFDHSLNPKYPYIYHVPRETFDDLLMNHAKSLGVTVFQPEMARDVVKRSDMVLVNGHEAKLLVRASGITTAQVDPDNYVKNDADDNATGIYSYFPYKARHGNERDGDILIDLFYESDDQRIPSWAWAIPITPDIMSVGYVLRTPLFAKIRKDGTTLNQMGAQLLGRVPFIRDALSSDVPLEDYRMRFNFQRVARQIVFDREVRIGDAAGFIDPVFSSGVHIGLNSARMAADAIVNAKTAQGDFEMLPLLNYQNEYRRLFWIYYRFVKTFYEKNLVENFFLIANPGEDPQSVQITKEFTSILSGDVDSPNGIIRSLENSRLTINPEVRKIFENQVSPLT